MKSFISYLKATKEELKEVHFPSVAMTITYTLIVIAVSVVVALMLAGVDLGLKEMLSAIIAR